MKKRNCPAAKGPASQLPLNAHICSLIRALAIVGLQELAAQTILSESSIISGVPSGFADSQAYSDAV